MSANGSTVSKSNTTDFLRAVRENDTTKVHKFILAGQDVNMFFGEKIPLYIAIQNNSIPMVKLLLEANAAVNTLVETETILYFAVSQGNVQIVELLLRAGGDPEFENMDKKTPLFAAVEKQSVKLIQLLCEYNADPNHKAFSDKPIHFAKSDRVKKALEACVPERKGYRPTLRSIQTTIFNLIDTKGTFPIQSQKTGQCFSDSLQHVIYFADGIRDFFIEKAVEVYPRIKAAGELPLTQDEYMASLTNTIKARHARIKKAVENNGRTYNMPLNDNYISILLPTEAVRFYLDVTGVRFLDMFLRPIIQAPLSKKAIMTRRPSVVSFFANQPTGIVCSQILNIYQVTKSILENRKHFLGNSNYNEANARVSRESNLPHTLNEEGFGLLSDSIEYDFWEEILKNIPKESGKAIIKGGTENPKYKMFKFQRNKVIYAVDPNTIVGILYGVFPVGKIRRNLSEGHALSMVKTRGQWYVCDDNIGVAIPCGPFKMEDLIIGQFKIRYSGFKIQYLFYDDLKFDRLLEEATRKHPGVINLRKYLPEENYITILAEVPLKAEYKDMKIYEESLPGGEGGYMDMSISRKYICWEPAAAPAAAAPVAAALSNSNNTVRALAAKYGVNFAPAAAGSGV